MEVGCHGNGWVGLKRRMGGGEEDVLDHHGDECMEGVDSDGGRCDV